MIHAQEQLSYRDQELERLRNDLDHHPKDDNEKIRIFQKTFDQLQTAVDDARKYIDLLGNVLDWSKSSHRKYNTMKYAEIVKLADASAEQI